MSGRSPRNRRAARVLALMALFEADLAGHPVGDALARHLHQRAPVDTDEAATGGDDNAAPLPPARDVVAYASVLVSGVTEARAEIDARLAACAPEHPVADLAAIDRNILRIAIFELRANLAPVKVIVNEAIELAKLYGADASARFAHGVLGSIVAQLPPPTESTAPVEGAEPA